MVINSTKQELKYILFSVAFAVGWFLLILPFLIDKFDGNSPYIQFLLFNLGLILILEIFIKSFTLKRGLNLLLVLGIIFLHLAIDVIEPPYAVTLSGQLISEGPMLMVSSIDYVIGFFGSSLGISGIFLYAFTYIISPLILFYLASKLLKNMVKFI